MDTVLLIADEDQRVKNIVRFTFEQMDFKVLSTNSGVDAVSKAKETKPDIILVDVSLPDKNGYDVSREIKSNPTLKNTSVILLISSFVTFDKTKVTECLADDFIIKPFVFEEIIQKVKSITANAPRNSHQTKLPITINGERKEAFAKSILALLLISIVFTVSHLLSKNTTSTPNAQSSLNSSNGEFKNEPGFNKLFNHQSSSGHLFERDQEIKIILGKNGDIYINDTGSTFSELKSEISKLAANFGNKIEDQVVSLKADGGTSYGKVMEVAAEVKKIGVKKVELDTEPNFLSKSEDFVSMKGPEEQNKKTPGKELLQSSGEPIKTESQKQEKPGVANTVVLYAAKDNDPTNLIYKKKTSSPKESTEKTAVSKEPKKGVIRDEKNKTVEKKLSEPEKVITYKIAKGKVSEKHAREESKRASVKTSTKRLDQSKQVKYVVKKSDTLWSISNKFKTSVEELKVINKLRRDNIRAGEILIVPKIKDESPYVIASSKKEKGRNFKDNLKIVGWSLYVAWGIPTIHNVTIQNTSNITYSHIRIKAQYYSSYSADIGKLGTAEVEGILPVTVAPYTKKTYLQNGFRLKQGSLCGMFGGVKDIKIIAANPVGKDMNFYSSR